MRCSFTEYPSSICRSLSKATVLYRHSSSFTTYDSKKGVIDASINPSSTVRQFNILVNKNIIFVVSHSFQLSIELFNFADFFVVSFILCRFDATNASLWHAFTQNNSNPRLSNQVNASYHHMCFEGHPSIFRTTASNRCDALKRFAIWISPLNRRQDNFAFHLKHSSLARKKIGQDKI